MSGASAEVKEPYQATSRPKESALALLWQNAHTLARGLVTEDGTRLRVVYPGRYNAGPGPDFRDAVLANDAGRLVSGDIELHVNAREWYVHGHHIDRNYNGVVLHVVLRPNGRSFSGQQSNASVPIAALEPVLDDLQHADGAEAGRAVFQDVPKAEDLGVTLDRAGDRRFYARSRGFTIELRRNEPEEVVYSALMETLGYSSNRKAFRELARAVPVSTLASLRREPRSVRVFAVEAMLFNASGLSSTGQSREEPITLLKPQRYLPETGRVSACRWRPSRGRPANNPARRIAGAARLLDRFLDTGLARGLEEGVKGSSINRVTQRLTVPPYIGRGRARDMMVNVVLPFLHCWAVLKLDGELKDRCVQAYQVFPKLDENEITREMRRLLCLCDDAVTVTGARRQQGLIHVYRTVLTRFGGGAAFQ